MAEVKSLQAAEISAINSSEEGYKKLSEAFGLDISMVKEYLGKNVKDREFLITAISTLIVMEENEGTKNLYADLVSNLKMAASGNPLDGDAMLLQTKQKAVKCKTDDEVFEIPSGSAIELAKSIIKSRKDNENRKKDELKKASREKKVSLETSIMGIVLGDFSTQIDNYLKEYNTSGKFTKQKRKDKDDEEKDAEQAFKDVLTDLDAALISFLPTLTDGEEIEIIVNNEDAANKTHNKLNVEIDDEGDKENTKRILERLLAIEIRKLKDMNYARKAEDELSAIESELRKLDKLEILINAVEQVATILPQIKPAVIDKTVDEEIRSLFGKTNPAGNWDQTGRILKSWGAIKEKHTTNRDRIVDAIKTAAAKKAEAQANQEKAIQDKISGMRKKINRWKNLALSAFVVIAGAAGLEIKTKLLDKDSHSITAKSNESDTPETTQAPTPAPTPAPALTPDQTPAPTTTPVDATPESTPVTPLIVTPCEPTTPSAPTVNCEYDKTYITQLQKENQTLQEQLDTYALQEASLNSCIETRNALQIQANELIGALSTLSTDENKACINGSLTPEQLNSNPALKLYFGTSD